MVNAQSNVQTLPLISAIKVEAAKLRPILVHYRKHVAIKVETSNANWSKLWRYIPLFFTFPFLTRCTCS